MITSVCFSPSGNQALAGLFNGQVFFWHTDSQGLDSAPEVDTPSSSMPPTPNALDVKKGDNTNGSGTVAAVAARLMAESHVRLRYYTQVEARNRRGKFHEGRKVTGLSWLPTQALRNNETKGNFVPAPGADAEEVSKKAPGQVVASTKSISTSNLPQQLLVTTNDSRVRLFQMETFSQLCKFKGLMNENMQIRSSFSWDGKYVVSGSENGHVHIWNTSNDYETAQEMSGEHLQNVGGKRWLPTTGGRHDRNQAHESFRATHVTRTTDSSGNECSMPAIATAAIFAPFSTVSLAAAASDVHMLYTDLEQLANSIIVVADYSGQLRFFMRASADDEIDNFGDMF
jgi:WD40 repeat protein